MTDETKVSFKEHERTPAQRLTNAMATVTGTIKLLERARTGDPAEARSNISCATKWLKIATDELDQWLKDSEK